MTRISTDMNTWIVLIVDDEPDNVDVARKMLAYQGAEVFTAMNGVEGLEILKGLRPTFILLDLSMPEMDGWQMFENLRANPETADIPVIALTAHAMPGDQEQVLEMGFNGYIAKPFRLNTFLETIQECIQQISLASNN